MFIIETDTEMCQVSQNKSLGDTEETETYFKDIL